MTLRKVRLILLVTAGILNVSLKAEAANVATIKSYITSVEVMSEGPRRGTNIGLLSNHNPHHCAQGGGIYNFNPQGNGYWDKVLALATIAKESETLVLVTVSGCSNSGYPAAKGIQLLQKD